MYLDFGDDFKRVKDFLESLNLKMPTDLDYTIGIYEENKLIGTGSLSGNIIKGVGVSPEHQGKSVSTKIITNLLNKGIELNRHNIFIYTDPKSQPMFIDLGFKKIGEALPHAVLLEWGGNLEKHTAKLKDLSKDRPVSASAVVINANPFTLGHRHLIEKAMEKSKLLYIIVVEEDKSLFPFKDRFKLVKEGVRDMKGVKVIAGGDYVISAATFPSYFTKEANLAITQASLDLDLFSKHIGPSLNITERFVGEEAYSPVTSIYNEEMKRILPERGIKVTEIPRLESGGRAISASRVRKAMEEGNIESIKDIVPKSTYDYLKGIQEK